MQNETEFNAYLSRRFRQLRPNIYHHKASEMVKAGVPDFMVFTGNLCATLECKFVGVTPNKGAMLLKHKFSAEQQNFFTERRLAGSKLDWGLVGIKETGRMVLVPAHEIPESGNWNSHDFHLQTQKRGWSVMPVQQVSRLVEEIFGRTHDSAADTSSQEPSGGDLQDS